MAKVYDRATQQVVDVPAAEAQRGISEGQYQATGRVQITRDNGETGTVDASELNTALQSGFRIVDDDEAAELVAQGEAESTGGILRGVAEGAAAGATLGLSSMTLEGLGVDPEGMRRRREAAGTLGTAAELVGAAAPALLSGGASAGATAGRGLAATVLRSTPAGLAARAGARVEGALAARMGTGAASRILPSGARNFVEGGLQGGGAQLDENVLGDRELGADLLGSTALGGLFGAGTGYGVQGLAQVAAGGARASVRGMQGVLGRLNSSSGGLASREVAEHLVRQTDELSGGARTWKQMAISQGLDEATADRLAHLGDTAEGRGIINRLERDRPRIEREAAELVSTRTNELHAELREVQKLATGEGKVRNWERLVPSAPENLRAAAFATDDLLVAARNGMDDTIRQMEADLARYKASTHNGAMLKQADEAIGRMHLDIVEAEKLAGKAKIARKAAAVDNYKRRLGVIVEENGGWGSMRAATPEMRTTNMHLRKMYSDARDLLERDDIWGGAAAAQREINGAYSAMAQADDLFEEATKGTGLSSIVDDSGTINMQKAVKLVRAHGRVGGDVTVTRLMDAMKARAAYAKKIGEHVELDDVARGRISKVEKSVTDLEREFKRQAVDAGHLDDLMEARRVESGGSPSITTTATSLGSLLGFTAGGPVGAVLGAGLVAARQPYTTLHRYAALRGALDKADKRLGGAIAGMFGKAKQLKMPEIEIPRVPTGVVGRAAGGADAERTQKREFALARAAELASSPGALERALAVPHADLHDVAPGLAGVMQQRAQVAATFLASKAPKVYSRSTTKLVDPVSAASFERYLEAVADPIGALSRFAEGRITAETAEAIRVCYPALYADIQRRIQDELAEAQAEGREIPYDRRVRLGMLFQTPTDPSLQAPIANEIQMAIGAQYDEPDAAQLMAGANKPSGKAGKIEGNTKALQTSAERASSWRTA